MTAALYPFYLYTAIVESIDLAHTWFLIFKKVYLLHKNIDSKETETFRQHLFYFLYTGILPTVLEESRREQHFPGIGD